MKTNNYFTYYYIDHVYYGDSSCKRNNVHHKLRLSCMMWRGRGGGVDMACGINTVHDIILTSDL